MSAKVAPQNLLNSIQIGFRFFWPPGNVTGPFAITVIISNIFLWLCSPFMQNFVYEIPVRQIMQSLILCWTGHWWEAGLALKHLVSQSQWDTLWTKHRVAWLPPAPSLGVTASGAIAILKQVSQSSFLITYNIMYFLRLPKLTLNASLCQGLLLVKSW